MNHRIRFQLDAYCENASPLNDFEELKNEPFYSHLIDLINKKSYQDAVQFSEQHFEAEYYIGIGGIESFSRSDITFIKTTNIGLYSPYLFDSDGLDLPVFQWISTEFLLEGPTEVLGKWMQITPNNKYIFSQENFNSWMLKNGNESLQDGCCYNFGNIPYGLEGIGENGCEINQIFIENQFNINKLA